MPTTTIPAPSTDVITTALASTSRSNGEFTVNAELQTFPHFDVVNVTTSVLNEEGVYSSVTVSQYDHENGIGSHTGVDVHRATAIEIEDSTFGPSIVIRTAAGYSVRIHTYGTKIDGERQPVIVTDNRS